MKRAALLVAILATTMACSGRTVTYYRAIVDELAVPNGWTVARTDVNDCVDTPVTDCPTVTRYYITDTTTANAYLQAIAAVSDPRFQMERDFGCEGVSPACAFLAIRDGDELWVTINEPGRSDDVEIDRFDRVTVRVIARPQ